MRFAIEPENSQESESSLGLENTIGPNEVRGFEEANGNDDGLSFLSFHSFPLFQTTVFPLFFLLYVDDHRISCF